MKKSTKPAYVPPRRTEPRRPVGSLYECGLCKREQVVEVDEFPHECCGREMDYRGGKFLDK